LRVLRVFGNGVPQYEQVPIAPSPEPENPLINALEALINTVAEDVQSVNTLTL
jgi:hypothetical protein